MINPAIFREYDIRGVWQKDLTEEVVERIGRAFAVYLRNALKKEKVKVSIGRDVRLSSSLMLKALSQGLLNSGVDIVDIGVCPTPAQYFSLFHLLIDGGVMITGSHNPPEFNGMKLSADKETLYGEKIQDIRRIAEKGDYIRGAGKTEVYEIMPEYLKYLRKSFPVLNGFFPPAKRMIRMIPEFACLVLLHQAYKQRCPFQRDGDATIYTAPGCV